VKILTIGGDFSGCFTSDSLIVILNFSIFVVTVNTFFLQELSPEFEVQIVISRPIDHLLWRIFLCPLTPETVKFLLALLVGLFSTAIEFVQHLSIEETLPHCGAMFATNAVIIAYQSFAQIPFEVDTV
jgi:hypothetical protein